MQPKETPAPWLADNRARIGRLADLVLLDADPTCDIRNASRIRAVVVNGRLLTRKDLDRLLLGAEAYARAH